MQRLCCEGCFTVLQHHFSRPFFPMSHRSREKREMEEFAAALHLFSGCCLSVCFVLSNCVFKHRFLPARDTWKEPWHEQKTSPQRRGGGGGWNDNTRKETRPRNKLRLNHKTIKLQRWEGERERKKNNKKKTTQKHTQQWKQIKQANRECCVFVKRPWRGQITPTASCGCLASKTSTRVLLEMGSVSLTKWHRRISLHEMWKGIRGGSSDVNTQWQTTHSLHASH